MSKSRSKQKADILDAVENISVKPTVINKDNIDTIDLSKVKFAPGRPVDPNSESYKKKQGQLSRKMDYIKGIVQSGKQILLQEDDDQFTVSEVVDENEMKES